MPSRNCVLVAKTATQDDVHRAAMADPAIAKFVTGTPRKIVFVPGRLLSIVL